MDQNAGNATVYALVVKNPDGSQKTINYRAEETLAKDLQFLLTVFCIRGCCWDKIIQKSGEDACLILNHLKEKLQFDTTVRPAGKSLPDDIITVARLAACFPIITITYSMQVLQSC